MVKRRNWTREEEAYLEENYGKIPTSEIGEKLNRSMRSVQEKAKQLDLESDLRGPGRRWKKDELDFLKEEYENLGAAKIGRKLNRSKASVQGKARSLGLRTDVAGGGSAERWDSDEVEYLRENYSDTPVKEIAEKLGRSRDSVYGKARSLGLRSKTMGRGETWEEEEVDFLKSNYGEMETEKIAEKLGKSPRAVYHMVDKLDLEMDDPWRFRRGEKMAKSHGEEALRKIAERSFPEKPTSPERRVIGIIDDYSLPFKYVGKGDVIIGGLIPDFIDCDGSKRIIEVFGDYWHTGKDVPHHRTEEGRRKRFSEYGFDLLVLWESEMKDLSDAEIAERIRRWRVT